ncbi:MAG TPA: hypothetical protein VGY98_10160 [Verrucomicrobiae bacterium]|nr:hypothetical protein [Verrucomicrobiae bacterium]
MTAALGDVTGADNGVRLLTTSGAQGLDCIRDPGMDVEKAKIFRWDNS